MCLKRSKALYSRTKKIIIWSPFLLVCFFHRRFVRFGFFSGPSSPEPWHPLWYRNLSPPLFCHLICTRLCKQEIKKLQVKTVINSPTCSWECRTTYIGRIHAQSLCTSCQPAILGLNWALDVIYRERWSLAPVYCIVQLSTLCCIGF